MTQRHFTQSDATFFVTTCTKDRKPIFLDTAYAREAVETLYKVQALHPFDLYSFVIMPDHCHFHFYIPKNESVSNIMCSYKSAVVMNTGLERIWQRRFHVRLPTSNCGVKRYVHMNPVLAGLVEHPEDYKWSSASGLWKVEPLYWN